MAKGLSGCKPPPRDGTFDVKFTSGKATGHILLRIGVDLMEIDDDLRSRFTGKPEDSLEVGHNVKVKYIAEGRKVKNLTGRFLPAQIVVESIEDDIIGLDV